MAIRGANAGIAERGQFPRVRVMGVGKISVSEREPSMDCIVLD